MQKIEGDKNTAMNPATLAWFFIIPNFLTKTPCLISVYNT